MDAKTLDDLFSKVPREAMEKMGEIGADFIRQKLAQRSLIADLFRTIPAHPYQLALFEGRTHYVGYVIANGTPQLRRLCDLEDEVPENIVTGDAPTCLNCATHP